MTQVAHPLSRRPRTWLAAVALVAVVVAAASAAVAFGSRADNRSAPSMRADAQLTTGRATPDSLRMLAVADLGSTTDVPRYAASSGLDRVRAAAYRSDECTLAINTDYTPALHTVSQLIEQQGPMLAAAFTDAGLRTLTVVTYGPSSTDGTVAQNPLFALRCDRSGVTGAHLATASASAIQAACDYTPYVS
jgi:hypothetical protein